MKSFRWVIGSVLIILFSLIFITACGSQKPVICNKPYMNFESGCCLDKDDDKICDEHESGTSVQTSTDTGDSLNDSSVKDVGSEGDVEKVALVFANAWESGDYELLYDFFAPELQSLKSKPEFVRILNATKIIDEASVVRVDDVKVINDTLAFVYLHVSGYSLFTQEVPALQMNLIDGEWKIDAFGHVFSAQCVVDTDCIASEKGRFECESDDVTKFTYAKCQNLFCVEDCTSYGYMKKIFCNKSGGKVSSELCNRAEASQRKADINFRYNPEEEILVFRNKGLVSLTDVKITINGLYVLENIELPIGREVIINQSRFLDPLGRSFTSSGVDKIYLYSPQAKWIYGPLSWPI